jgi:hypothetical protein
VLFERFVVVFNTFLFIFLFCVTGEVKEHREPDLSDRRASITLSMSKKLSSVSASAVAQTDAVAQRHSYYKLHVSCCFCLFIYLF